ncbi:MAG: rimO [Chlamydiales bacterium]|jgi:ribosomal protein S12 methylthiotransferase|nr:rimO [Chlamydiales bacterium]
MIDQQNRPLKPNFHLTGNKIFFISLGCPRNLVDSEVMLGILLKAGYEMSPALEEADFIVINTCGFLDASRQESIDTIQDAHTHKKASAKLIVTGCMVTKHSDELHKNFPTEINYLLGSGDVEAILKAVQAEEKGQDISQEKSYLEMGEVPRMISTPKHYAYLKIAEGCRKRCAFCIIPQIKGPLKSKSKEQIVKEFHSLLDQGVKEVILIAQDLGDYAKDRGAKGSEGLLDLLESLLDNQRDFWIRLLYLYPDEITDDIIALIKKEPRICRYLDMPLQHISDRILAKMLRKTDRQQIISILTKLRKEIPEICIRTSLMVGFPGETEEDVQELITFLQEHPLDNVGIFQYSKEDESFSAKMEDHLPEEVKKERYDRAMQAQQEALAKHNRRWVGKTVEVVIEGYHPDSQYLMRGRFYGQCPEIDGIVIINDTRKVDAFGERYLVKITDALGYDLVGAAISKRPFKKDPPKSSLSSKLSLV